MQTDSLKMVFTYVIALVVIAGGGVFLFVSMGTAEAESTRVVVAGFMGAAITFVFNAESSTRATRAAQSSNAAGAATATGVTPAPPNPPTAGA